jgi:hypothetical protein
VYEHYKTHTANGEAARMVLYHYDFVDGGGTLSPRGLERLAEIATLLPRTFFPVVIEPHCDPAVSAERQAGVISHLVRGPFPIPPERVVVGKPPANGLSGQEAALIYQNLLYQTQVQGTQGGLGGGSIGGTVGQGFSAPGRTSSPTGGAPVGPPP